MRIKIDVHKVMGLTFECHSSLCIKDMSWSDPIKIVIISNNWYIVNVK